MATSLLRPMFPLIPIMAFLWPRETAHGAWMQSGGPCGGSVSGIAVHGGTLYAGTAGGIFLSKDGGVTWSRGGDDGLKSTFGMIPTLHAIFHGDSSLLAGTEGDGVYLSRDEGAHWIATSGYTTYAFAQMGRRTFGAVNPYGFIASPDKGANWAYINLVLGGTANALWNSGKYLLMASSGIYRSADSGLTWSEAAHELGVGNLNSLAGTDRMLAAGNYKGSADPYLFVSRDSGTTWKERAIGAGNGNVLAVGGGGGKVFAGTDSGRVAFSPDTAESWTFASHGLPANPVISLAFSDSMVLAGTMSDGIFVTMDYGRNWRPRNTGFAATNIIELRAIGDTLFASAIDGISQEHHSRLYRSMDNGTTWERIGADLPQGTSFGLYTLGRKLFIALPGSIFVSTDLGDTWRLLPLGNESDTLTGGLSGYDDRIFASTTHRVLVSGDSGSTWNESLDFPSGGRYEFARNGRTLIAADTWNGGYSRSTDDGKTWTRPDNAMQRQYIYHMAVADGFILATTLGGLIYVSGDNGDSWTRSAASDNSTSPSFQGIFTAGGKLFGYGRGYNNAHRFYVSPDHGATWTGADEGLGNLVPTCFIQSGETLFIGTNGSGVWRRSLSEMGASGTRDPRRKIGPRSEYGFTASRQGASAFHLSFELPRSETVLLSVSDMNQKRVALIAHRRFPSGRQSLDWNAPGLASGAYAIEMRVGRGVVLRTIDVVR